MNIYIIFYDLRLWWVHDCIKWFTGDKYDHCSIVYETKEERKCLHVTRDDYTSWEKERVMHRVLKPTKIFYIGNTDISIEELNQAFLPPRKWSVFSVVLWWFVMRWCSDWKPKGSCTVIVSKMLNILGVDVDIHVRPDELCKELEDANYFYRWASGDWKDNSSQDHSQ